MPEGLAAALATPGLLALLVALLAAGVVYGFAGFGSALIFIPAGSAVVGPETAVAAFAIASLGSVATVLPGAWARADRRATGVMIAAASLSMPAGVWLLRHGDPEALRWAVSGLVAATLAATMAGLRLRVGDGTAPRAAVGALTGVVGGATGLLGPIVILVGLGSGAGAVSVRANIAAFLTVINVVLLPQLALQGGIGPSALWLGALALPLYTLGTLVGRALFRPGAERFHRGLAYAVVGASAVAGLPLFD